MTHEIRPELPYPPDLSIAPIRRQLLWATFFPVVLFSLLSILAFSSALNRLNIEQTSRRSADQARGIAASLAVLFSSQEHPSPGQLQEILKNHATSEGGVLLVLDEGGGLAAGYPPVASETGSIIMEIQAQARSKEQGSVLVRSSTGKNLVSFASLPGKPGWKAAVAAPRTDAASLPVNFLPLLVVLLCLGAFLSLGMLSLAIGRIIQPITLLAENASQAVPGSLFRPISEHGPSEIRSLIRAFNQMVIRLAEQQTTLRQYAHKALLSQEEERQRLSHELHDGTLQDLVGLAQRVELCRNELERDPLMARHRLDELHLLLEQAIDDMRRISSALRPPVLEDFGLSVALEALCKDLLQEKPGLQCEYRLSGKARRLSPDIELAVYRVVQEAMSNIRKHVPNARLVWVELTFGEQEIEAVIKNDGGKFIHGDVRSFVKSGHLGLAGMYERARLFGGNLSITSDPDENTVVSLKLPCTQESF